jgi:hypothetical protein
VGIEDRLARSARDGAARGHENRRRVS